MVTARLAAIPKPSAEVIFGVALGVVAAAIAIFSMTTRGPIVALIAMVAIPVAAFVVLRPRMGMILLIFCMSFVEEFRGGIGDTNTGGDEQLRSERTPFYAATLGLPALYLPDVMIGGVLLLYLFKTMLWRQPLPFRMDKIATGLAILGTSLLFSVVIPLWGNEPWGPKVLDLSTLGTITLPEKNVSDVARYLAVLQVKLFAILFPSYLVGLFFFREDRDVEQTVKVIGAAMVGTLMLAMFRLGRDPGMVSNLVPVVFDTGSVALMAMAVFYSIGRWASGHYNTKKAIVQAIFCSLLMVFILLSFRRTMWGAIALAILFFPFILPRHALRRLFIIVAVGISLALVLVVVTPAGQALIQSIASRASETHLNQSSTLYRFAIATWVVQNIVDLPLFGYGLAPLWNEKVYIRFFVTSMENVHSLYIWILTRMGLIGILASAVATALILWRIRQVFNSMKDEEYRILVGVIFLSVVMLLFNGVFNPVYANVRHLVPLGLSLALVSCLPDIIARRATKAPRAE